jgi:CheY-like chemotaxis protein
MTRDRSGSEPPRVLIVDDDQQTIDTFARTLRLEGYQVDTALDSLSALRVMRAGTFDAVLLDLQMPLADGLDVLRRIRSLPTSRGTPVAVVTGDYAIDDGTLAELERLGAVVRYKPLWIEELIELTHTLIKVGKESRPAL